MSRSIHIFIPLAVVLTFMAVATFGVGQYILRQSANDPQVQIAEDAVISLGALTEPPRTPPQKVDMVKSLAPYLVLYNDRGQAVVGNVQLDGKIPVPPRGVLEYVRKNKRETVTWEPRKGVRHAVVVMRVDGERPGFVLAGRSLRETEKRIRQLFVQVIFIYIIAVFTTFVSIVLFAPRTEPNRPRGQLDQ